MSHGQGIKALHILNILRGCRVCDSTDFSHIHDNPISTDPKMDTPSPFMKKLLICQTCFAYSMWFYRELECMRISSIVAIAIGWPDLCYSALVMYSSSVGLVSEWDQV